MPQQCDICTAHIDTHEWAHTKSIVKSRRHKSANTVMQTDTYTLPLFSYTPANTQSGNLPVHTQQYTFCLFVCLSLCEAARLLVHRSVRQLLCPYIASCFSPLPSLYPSHPAYHIPTVSLPINAHRAALQWGWRVPRQQAQYRVYRHACTCQPGRARGRGGWGSEGKEEEGGGEKEQRRVNGEYVESGRQDGVVPHCTYTQTYSRM